MDAPPQPGHPPRSKGRKPWQKGYRPRQKQLKQQQRGRQQQQQGGLGFFTSVPSLEDMRKENQQRTRRHYGGGSRSYHGHRPGPQRGRPSLYAAPLSVPPAPQNQARFIVAGANPLDTPAQPAAELDAGAADKLEAEGFAADLNFYGTNEGLIVPDSPSSNDDLDDLHSDLGEGEEEGEAAAGASPRGNGDGRLGLALRHGGGGGGGGDTAPLPPHIKSQLSEQEAYIEALEEQNLRLRERLDMLQQEVADLRDALEHNGNRASDHSDAEEHSVMQGN